MGIEKCASNMQDFFLEGVAVGQSTASTSWRNRFATRLL